MKKWIMILLVAIMLVPTTALPASAASTTTTAKADQDVLVLTRNSNKVTLNGKAGKLAQPLAEKKGVTYVPARSLADQIYAKVSYDAKKKEYTIKNEVTDIRLTVGRKNYSVNGTVYQGNAAYVEKGTLMVPLQLYVMNFGLKMDTNSKAKTITLMWNVLPVAKFAVTPTEVYAQQTPVSYKSMAYHPKGLSIVDERWEGNLEIFDQAGEAKITHWVQDAKGVWSEPYTVSITVRPPNQPPVANFVTDKTSYKIGEWINYSDLSTDDENRITNVSWVNREDGFFQAGEQTVSIIVTDAHGEVSEYSQKIMIEDVVLHTKEQFPIVYSNVGDKIEMNGKAVVDLPTIPYTVNSYHQTLMRSNSPELIKEDGIYYTDTATDKVRFLVHNENSTTVAKRVYVIATNNNAEAAEVYVDNVGVGGPSLYVSSTGKQAVGKFLESRQTMKPSVKIDIPAGESRMLFPEQSANPLNPGYVLTLYGDVHTDSMIQFSVVVVGADEDVIKRLPELPLLNRDGKHIRGTFEMANRSIVVNKPIGEIKERMIVADKVVDSRLSGTDMTNGDTMSNDGNNGALYMMTFTNVLPNTAILINPRGGHYSGAFNVNGQIVYTTAKSILKNANESAILYKTGDVAENVSIVFTPASGSNLPINLLFIPLAGEQPVKAEGEQPIKIGE
ncbi:copper amine oxidase N-terminal domain-containing protein [Cohnella sp. WQ 127256]|uniref:copper amine oxidase N-terminal domain-containing protein n=1 Tax=Cohnella sp. WQ 127256 TaxID=2938790 RepID=UPI002119B389|nr:copper amine oxidase N-terminal domain-containing protein [Cohnella sp. WQ 127256]